METGCVDVWVSVRVPVLDASGWLIAERRSGLRELERIIREAHAAMAVVIAAMPESRDKTTDISRTCGVSAREARERRKVAAVYDRFPRAAELLRNGAVSPELLSALEPVLDRPGAEGLLDAAVGRSPEEFRAAVEEFRLAGEHGGDTAKRQHARRDLRIFPGPDGMVGFRGVLPPVEGKSFQNTLSAIVDAKWRKEHPERAETLGGHGGDDHAQRMADALLDLAGIGGIPATGHPTGDNHAGGSGAGGSGAGDGSSAQQRNLTTIRAGKPSVVIVFNVDRWKASLIGHGPIPVTPSLFDQTRAELYYLFENLTGEVMKFGRARRDPSPLQRLAVIARDQFCVYPDCTVPADRCQIHHFDEVLKDHGFTDVELLGALCGPHHPHIHHNNLLVRRETDGSVTIRDRDSGRIIAGPAPGRRDAA